MSTPFVMPAPPALLLVEGKTMKVFFDEWLRRLEKSGVQVIDFGGTAQLNGTLQRVVDPVFRKQGRNLAVIRDAERDAGAAFQSVCGGGSKMIEGMFFRALNLKYLLEIQNINSSP